MLLLLLQITIAVHLTDIQSKIPESRIVPNHYANPTYSSLGANCFKFKEPEVRNQALKVMWENFEALLKGEESYFYLALQPIYNFFHEVAQYEVLQRSKNGQQNAFGALFANMNAEQWKQWVSLNARFAIENAEFANTPVSFNLPAFLLGAQYTDFIDEIIEELRNHPLVIVEISEKGLGGDVKWSDYFYTGIRKIAKANIKVAFDDISVAMIAKKPEQLQHFAGQGNYKVEEAYPMTLERALELRDVLYEYKIDMTDTSLIYKSFAQAPFMPNAKQKLAHLSTAQVAVLEDRIFRMVTEAVESNQKVVFEWSIHNVMTAQQSLIFRAYKNLLLIQGGHTSEFALSAAQFQSLYAPQNDYTSKRRRSE